MIQYYLYNVANYKLGRFFTAREAFRYATGAGLSRFEIKTKDLGVQKIHISVTAAEIEAGVPKSPESCPIALAIQKVLNPGWKQVTVAPCVRIRDEYDRAWDTFDDKQEKIIEAFTVAFDAGEPVQPFEMDLCLEEHENEEPRYE